MEKMVTGLENHFVTKHIACLKLRCGGHINKIKERVVHLLLSQLPDTVPETPLLLEGEDLCIIDPGLRVAGAHIAECHR